MAPRQPNLGSEQFQERELNAEELAALAAAKSQLIGRQLDARKLAAEVSLRRWCVDKAIDASKGIVATSPSDVIETARNIRNFLMEELDDAGRA